ncbi:hypothetical protein LWI28_014371 [Acer negundo]|uniref:Uncharacterized protein n=1 Tax=Acer negundo TaxID=4023 RepID=A0AAD5ILV8_ACENE|nr:hypothetical protein LWI28_014371 [Acer negundo]
MERVGWGPAILAFIGKVSGAHVNVADKKPVVFATSTTIALPVPFPDFSSPTSNSHAANVGISLRPSRPTTTPPLAPTKSQLSPPTTLPIPPTNCSPFSEITARAGRVWDLSSQTQEQTLTTPSVTLSESSPIIPSPLPPTSASWQPRLDSARDVVTLTSSQSRDKNLEEVVARFLKVCLRGTSPSIMYPSVILPTASLVSSSLSSISPIANVGISLGSNRSTDTPPLTPAKSRISLLAKLSTLPTARSPLSEMAARASRIQSILGQIQR